MFTLPLFIYGCKSWTIMIEENSRSMGSEMKCMSWIACKLVCILKIVK